MDKVPTDVRKALAVSPKTQALWKSLTPIARRDFLSWVSSAKQEATRKSRIGRIGSMLASGKRRPCCYAIVPMNLYRALGKSPKAKAFWSTLTPDERRDYADWVEQAKDSEARRGMVEKAIAHLGRGRKKP